MIVRMKKFISSNKKVFFKYTWSYLVIFLISILFLFVSLRFITNKVLKNQELNVEQILHNNVHSIQTTTDQYIERCQMINYVLLQKESMYYFLHFKAKYPGEDTADAYIVSKELKSLCLTDDYISDILICVNQNNININQQGKMSMPDVYKEYIEQKNGGLSYQEWLAETLSFTGGKIQSFKNDSLYFVRTYPVTPIGLKSDSITLIKIKDNIVNNALKGAENIDGAVVGILDNQTGKNFWVTGQNQKFAPDVKQFTGSNGYLVQDGYLISYQKSEQLSITYVSAVPQYYLTNQKNNIDTLTIVAFIICLILGCGLIVLLSLRKSNPVRQLLSLVNENGSGKATFLDPYLEIKSMLLDAADQKLAYMNQNEFIEKKKTFIAILYDKRSTAELIRHNAEQLGILYQNHSSCYIKLKCIDVSAYFEKINDYGKIECTPIQFCDTIITQILSEYYAITGIPYGQEAFFIITLMNKNIELFYREIKDHLQQAQHLLQESYGIDTLMTISNFHSDIKRLLTGFKEVNQTMEYMEFMGDRNFYEYNMVSILKKRNDFYTSSKSEAMMLSCIKSGDFIKAKSLFNDIINSYFQDMHNSPQTLKLRIYALISKIMESLNYIDVSDVNDLMKGLAEDSHFMNFNNIVEFQKNMNIVFDKLGEFLESTEGKEEDHFIKNIRDVISHNYMNPNLNVSMIANLLSKNLDYVSRTFKKITGNGLLDSIQEFRINKAKGYMDENPNLSILQISSMVGYVNCESFIRVFKHKEGVTPGRYKSTVRKE
jgi:two-component system, response regulator YesN